MISGFFNIPWFFWAGLALAVGILYSFVWPRKKVTGTTTDIRYLFVRWGHAAAWILLAVNFLLRGIDVSLNGSADLAAVAGGLMYALFMVMSFGVK